jgi:flagellar biosynthesis/type III secretory pathway protein FliH
MLGGFKMEETQVGKDLIEIGIEKGIEKGVEKGIEKGKQQTLLNLLSYKFGKIPEDIINRINSISDEMKLDDLSIKILELTDLDQLKRHLN